MIKYLVIPLLLSCSSPKKCPAYSKLKYNMHYTEVLKICGKPLEKELRFTSTDNNVPDIIVWVYKDAKILFHGNKLEDYELK